MVNDGTPIDLYIIRGSGTAKITIGEVRGSVSMDSVSKRLMLVLQNVYVNDPNDEKKKWFYHVPVVPTA